MCAKDWKKVDGGLQRKLKIKRLSKGSIKQLICWIGVPIQKWKSSLKKTNALEEISINNQQAFSLSPRSFCKIRLKSLNLIEE